MTSLAKEKVNSRVQNTLRARKRAESSSLGLFAITNWQEDAVTRFYYDYSIGSKAVPNTTAVFLGLCTSLQAGVCLKDALCAAAFANQANQLRVDWMAIKANEAYGRALKSLALALEDPVEALKDTTLAATFIISLYEVRPCPSLPFDVENRKADHARTGHQWLPANRYPHGSSPPPRSDVVAPPSCERPI